MADTTNNGYAIKHETSTSLGKSAVVICLATILIFVLLIKLPFIGKAFHIDDAIFWDFAKVNTEAPFQQHIPDYQLMGKDIAEWRDTHPPVNAIYMSLLMRLTGSDQEIPLHVGYIIFPFLAGVSMFFLTRRFLKNSLFATLLFLATPVVLVMSNNLMADVPLMAIWLAATATYIYGVDRDNLLLLIISGVLVTAAVFTGYQALALVLLLPAYSLIMHKLRWKNVWPLLLPVLAFFIFTLYNISRYGSPPRFSHAGGLSLNPRHVLTRAEGGLLQLGGITIFPPALILLFSIRKKLYYFLPFVMIGAITLGIVRYNSGEINRSSIILYVMFITATLMLIVYLLANLGTQLKKAGRREPVDSDFLFMALWVLPMIIGTIFLLPHASSKYILLFLAPVVILAFRELEIVCTRRLWLRAAAGAMIIFTLLTGSAISFADYQLASSYKDFALNVKKEYKTGGTIWFVGEWGFRHYMEEEGYRYLTSSNEEVADGDIIISPGVADWPLAESVESRMNLIDTVEIGSNFPVRLMSANAGFYGTHWGTMPYSVTNDVPVEKFEVYEVTAS